MLEKFVEPLYDAVLDCFKALPILFLAYLLVSFLSHDHSRKFSGFLSKSKKTSVMYASFLGCVPQCGFSSVVADLYSEKIVSLGTLVAVFVATSDEAIPIMLANPTSTLDILKLLAVKIVFAVFWGYVVDLIFKLFKRQTKQRSFVALKGKKFKQKKLVVDKKTAKDYEQICNGDENNLASSDKSHMCGHVHSPSCKDDCGHKHGHCCANNIFIDAFMHTFNIIIYIFVATFAINVIMACVGTEPLVALFTDNPYLQVLVASLIGLIPNCASSVLLVQLYVLSGVISFPALLAGLTAGAGVGMFVLFSKNKKHPLQNLAIVVLQYFIGVASGMLLTLFF